MEWLVLLPSSGRWYARRFLETVEHQGSQELNGCCSSPYSLLYVDGEATYAQDDKGKAGDKGMGMERSRGVRTVFTYKVGYE